MKLETVWWVRYSEEALSEEMSPDYLHVRQEGGRDSRPQWALLCHHSSCGRILPPQALQIVQIFFVSGVKVPVTVLRLRSRAIDPRYNLLPFLLQMEGLMPIKHDSGRGLSRVMGLKLTQLGGLYIENHSRAVRRVNSSFSPLYRSASIAARAERESGPFRPQLEASSSPL